MNDTYILHKSLDVISEQQWKNLLLSESANFFQTRKAIHFFTEVGLDTFTFVIERDQEITAVLSGIIQKEKGLKANFTSRAIIYGGPILSKNVSKSDVRELLKQTIANLNKKAIYIEIRNLNDYSSFNSDFVKAGFKYVPHLNFHLDCSDDAMMRKRMSKSKLRQVKKSLKEGAEIIEATSKEEVLAYYSILENLYKTKVKTPLPDQRFFVALWESKICTFLLIRFEKEIVGGIVCPILPKKVIYEWFVCGKDGVFKNVYPSILATWAAMDYASKNDIPRFDFMGAGKPNEDYGVREFKSKFGGEQVAHGRFLCVLQPILYKVGKTAVQLLKST